MIINTPLVLIQFIVQDKGRVFGCLVKGVRETEIGDVPRQGYFFTGLAFFPHIGKVVTAYNGNILGRISDTIALSWIGFIAQFVAQLNVQVVRIEFGCTGYARILRVKWNFNPPFIRQKLVQFEVGRCIQLQHIFALSLVDFLFNTTPTLAGKTARQRQITNVGQFHIHFGLCSNTAFFAETIESQLIEPYFHTMLSGLIFVQVTHPNHHTFGITKVRITYDPHLIIRMLRIDNFIGLIIGPSWG